MLWRLTALLVALALLVTPALAGRVEMKKVRVSVVSDQSVPRYLDAYGKQPSYDSTLAVVTGVGTYLLYVGVIDQRGATAPAPMIVSRVDEGADGTWDVVLFTGTPPSPATNLPYSKEFTPPVRLELRADANDANGDYADVSVTVTVGSNGIHVEGVSVGSGVTAWLEVEPLFVTSVWIPGERSITVRMPPLCRFQSSVVEIWVEEDGAVRGVDGGGNPAYFKDQRLDQAVPILASDARVLLFLPVPDDTTSVELKGSFTATHAVNDDSSTVGQGSFDLNLQPGNSQSVTAGSARLEALLVDVKGGEAIVLLKLSELVNGQPAFRPGDGFSVTFDGILAHVSSGGVVEVPIERTLTLSVSFGGSPGPKSSATLPGAALPVVLLGLALAVLSQRAPESVQQLHPV
ncbi:MAG: hypothetical protein ABGY09_00095 [Euryarchaeota archaeon]